MSLFRSIVAAHAVGLSAPALATDFFRGKTITLAIGSAPGGSYDAYARLIARHIGRHIPGNPVIVPRNLPGAAGVQAAQFAAKGPKDGTVLAATLNTLPMAQLVEPASLDFDVGQFNWIGSVAAPANVLVTWHTTGVKSLAEAMEKEVVIGASSAGTTMEMYPLMANNLFGTKFKVVRGYAGGAEINLAMERGEVGGRGSNSYVSYAFQNPDWLREKKLNILFQMTLERDPALPDVPALIEFARDEEQRRIISILAITETIGRSLFAPDGVPDEHVRVLRDALAEVVKDKDFLDDAARAKLEISFISGEKLQQLVGQLLKTPPETVAKLKSVVRSPAR